MNYEVDAADGTCLYRGADLELACRIHDRQCGARLRTLPPISSTRTCHPLRRRATATTAVTTTTTGRIR